MRKYFTLLLFLTSILSYGFAQVKTVTGTVRDSQSQAALPGVTVSASSGQSIQTNENGQYSIEVSATGSLIFRSIGYIQQTVAVNNQDQVDVFLDNADESLEEVVVIGYGTQKKADLTGAIGSVRAEEIAKQPAMSAMQSVQGKVAGLNIVASEAPGAAPNVIIRGLGTALGGRNPLYIVDGMPVENINNINPSDIESMDVLKDASSASIYGLRAANGVVIITTKKGKAGMFRINYESYAGMKNILNRVKMADGNQFRQYLNENLSAIGQTWSLSENQPYETDWYDEILKTGTVFNNAVNLSGGSENIDYFLSFNNFKDNGIIDGSRFTRNTVRNNNTYKFLDGKLRFNQTLNLTFTESTPKPFNGFNAAYRQSPLVPVFYPNGRSGRPFVNRSTGVVTYERQAGETVGSLNSIGNPVYEIARHNELQKSTMLQGGFEGQYKITDFLTINSRVGATKYFYKGRAFNDIRDGWLNADPTRTEAEFETLRTANPEAASYAYNSLNFNQNETFRWVWENFLTFQKSFDKHNVEATLGMSREKFGIGNRIAARGYDVPAQEQYWNIDLANSAASSNYQKTVEHTYYTPRALASYFGRVQYNYDSRYYLTATIRRDGSSAFRETGEYWGTFPSVGLGWTVSNENFMQDVAWLNLLKIRGNYGVLGNQDIPVNTSQIVTSPISNNNNYVFGPNQDFVYGASFGTPALPLGWEKTHETGVGLDFAFLNNQLSGSLDYYHKMNTNTILDVTPTLSSPYRQNFYAHGAKVLNQGIEAMLNWNKFVNEDFNYTVGVNYSYNKNEVTEVTPAYDGAIGGSLANGQITKQLRLGQPIYGWWMWEAEGVWQNAQEIGQNAKYGSPIPGHLRYKDQNEDGVIDNRDKIFFGSYIPTSTYGINVRINYKALDFSVYGYGVAGNKIYNALKGTRIDGGENITQETFQQRWTGEGSTNVHPGAARDAYASSYYLESGSYFRINNITLGYTFDKLYSSSSKLRLYVSAQNPFMFTKYSGFSPEIATDTGAPSGTTGIELSAYPTTRNFLFGLNLQF
ncbi:SusC/RagA family TonB-linked outer membrane protein [Sphingobacterium wenxiniae]|uniref:TonB-linked outer membrane protein, SusC/RagA family n=1 Tax=Sphingobacterium wenxiniae TaxID=683125 RepID=A0A1I6PAG8_9SPHI|nr:TonB-dependent receptor [Sphingobacterium wenxiniae]SFS37088.1 TonB-linked outer membrane protein, SusC/RagA family [Sphingobacterium wenxiniae]